MFTSAKDVNVKGEQRSGRPLTSTDEQRVKKIEEFVLVKRQMTLRDLTNTVSILKGTVNI